MGDINSEKRIVARMVSLYCRHKHKHSQSLCQDCDALLQYAHKRLDNCRFGNEKPACAKCPVHCYKPDMRQKIREVMRFSGPVMLFRYPVEFLKHYFPVFFKVS